MGFLFYILMDFADRPYKQPGSPTRIPTLYSTTGVHMVLHYFAFKHRLLMHLRTAQCEYCLKYNIFLTYSIVNKITRYKIFVIVCILFYLSGDNCFTLKRILIMSPPPARVRRHIVFSLASVCLWVCLSVTKSCPLYNLNTVTDISMKQAH